MDTSSQRVAAAFHGCRSAAGVDRAPADAWSSTVEFTVAGFVRAALLGLVLALMRLSKKRAVRAPAAVYTELFKNVPLLAIIFITYFGLASQGLRLSVFQAGALSLIIFYAAYLSETSAPRSPACTAASRRRPRRSACPAARRSRR